MKDYLFASCAESGFPAEASAALLAAYTTIIDNPQAREIFQRYIDRYNSDTLEDYKEALEQMATVAELTRISVYTVNLLFFLCLSRHMRELYRRRGFAEAYFHGVMVDLKCKLLECHKRNGIWGAFVGHWFPLFFQLARFAIGRLQFEALPLRLDCTVGARELKEGETVLNVHIPSSGPLRHEDCLESYRLADHFFRTNFDLSPGQPTIFHCSSWMLFPALRELLPPSSGIVQFANDYTVVSTTPDPEFRDAWRIFNQDYDGDATKLPRQTSLQRACADYLARGNVFGRTLGIFFFEA